MTISESQAKQLMSRNKKVYDRIASQFSDTRRYLWDDLKPLAKYTKDGNKVLDVACGNGRLYQLFEKKQVEYTGIDYSGNLIQKAKIEYPKAKFFVRNMCKINLPSASFHALYCIAAFQHLPTPLIRLDTLKQMHELLKRGGTLVFLNWNLHSEWSDKKYKKFLFEDSDFMIPWRDGDGQLIGERYYHGFTLPELKKLLEEAGFKDIRQWYTKKGKRSTKKDGENIITIARK